jgi:hypothetical protein
MNPIQKIKEALSCIIIERWEQPKTPGRLNYQQIPDL